MLQGGSRIFCMIQHIFPGLDLDCTDPTQDIQKAVQVLDHLQIICRSSVDPLQIVMCPTCANFDHTGNNECEFLVFHNQERMRILSFIISSEHEFRILHGPKPQGPLSRWLKRQADRPSVNAIVTATAIVTCERNCNCYCTCCNCDQLYL